MTGSVVRVGLLGCGNVGAALAQILSLESDEIHARTGVQLRLDRVAVRDTTKPRGVDLGPGVLTDDPFAVVADPDIDVVVELMGGFEPARSLVLAALAAGKPVVSANKVLLATAGAELCSAAAAARVDLLYEAAVGGAIPLIRPLRESLAGERITRVMGIVNGTTNFILSRMAEDKMAYEDALAEAQKLGFAEADPSADVDGHDSAAKAAIMATIAFGQEVSLSDVAREGISNISPVEVSFGLKLGYTLKLLAVAEARDGSGEVLVQVYPALVANDHPLASVREAYNAVFIEGQAVGQLMLYGPGAGGRPTAAAVLGDLVDAAHNLMAGSGGRVRVPAPASMASPGQRRSSFYVRLDVEDRPGVLAEVAGIFGRNGVSIRTMEQEGLADEARLIFQTHEAREMDMDRTMTELAGLGAVRATGVLLRMIEA
jgi:homoserine dehydrogenase